MKEKLLRANEGHFMTKELNEAIMTQSRLRNKYLKEKSADLKVTYKNKWFTVWTSDVGPKRIILLISTSAL